MSLTDKNAYLELQAAAPILRHMYFVHRKGSPLAIPQSPLKDELSEFINRVRVLVRELYDCDKPFDTWVGDTTKILKKDGDINWNDVDVLIETLSLFMLKTLDSYKHLLVDPQKDELIERLSKEKKQKDQRIKTLEEALQIYIYREEHIILKPFQQKDEIPLDMDALKAQALVSYRGTRKRMKAMLVRLEGELEKHPGLGPADLQAQIDFLKTEIKRLKKIIKSMGGQK